MADYIEQIVWHKVVKRPLYDEEWIEYSADYENSWDSTPSYIFEGEMPEDGQEVLVASSKHVWADACVVDCEGRNNLYYLDGGDWDDVIAWAAMPKYKGGDEQWNA